MSIFYTGMALFLLLNLGLGLVRIMKGPAPADRMMAAQLFGTTGAAILLLLSQGLDDPSLYKMALVFGLLSGLAAIAFVKSARARHDEPGSGADGAD
ncbi:MAG: multiple resistance and pH regulation protein F [Alphaproteobacteria bacterium]|uniref:Multiple resistance and pH regulation protein F n=1 Tax=Candidatus Nitrobium versatile TaxID=2884831 RepID=A0A953J7D9_9BACT|nr:multiple resistance and pH regulation protein F [Candidatus Nitrobium versatile]